ncbi:peptide chain release factor 1, partial [Schizopora paradoxa]
MNRRFLQSVARGYAGFRRGVATKAHAIQAFEKENARLLAIIQKKAEERNAIVARLEEGGSSADHISQARKLKELDPIHSAWTRWQQLSKTLLDTETLLEDGDSDIRALASEEYNSVLADSKKHIEEVLPTLIIPPSPSADYHAILELKSGVGGAESSLFLNDLMKMYSRYASDLGWQAKVISEDDRDGGGIKNATMEVIGDGAYDDLKWETGVHRVQRIPATEAGGRVHTSTVSLFVLPLQEEAPGSNTGAKEKLYDDKDIKIEVMRARGAGGQHVNKTESAVRLTHIPTGITVSMQDERSQHMNKARAYRVLEARLLDRKLQAEVIERRDARRQLVRSADRSEKIRTYNFVQDRVTDHRIGLTLTNIAAIMNGDVFKFTKALKTNYERSVVEDLLN